MSKAIENTAEKTFTGYSIIAEWTKYFAPIITGDALDYDIRCAIFHTHNEKTLPTEESQIFNEEMDDLLKQFKDKLRHIFCMHLENETKSIERSERLAKEQKSRQEKYKVVDGFRKMNSPAPEGTVKEIAQRYNISIGKVRELKRDNLLHTLND